MCHPPDLPTDNMSERIIRRESAHQVAACGGAGLIAAVGTVAEVVIDSAAGDGHNARLRRCILSQCRVRRD